MTHTEIRDALKVLGLNQAQAAEMLGYGAASRISDLVRDVERPSKTVIRLLRAYLDGYRPDDWPQPQ